MAITISAGPVELEAVLREPEDQPPRGAAVLCHPHPLYGGTMNNRVVFRSGKAALAAGLVALRFNFRGVGESTGIFDQGEGEKEDVSWAIDWLEARFPALPLALIGFSFGAWVGLRVGFQDPRIKALIGLGLPLTLYDFSYLYQNPKPSLYVLGENDEFCAQEKLEVFERGLPASSEVYCVKNADHFFTNELDLVQRRITDFFQKWSAK